MNIENLRAFVEIAATGSFQLAAERLYITQSAISVRIKTLEERINRKLFLRRRSGMELTRAGERLLRHAQSCVQSWERAQQEISLPDDIHNQLTLGIQLNFWRYIVGPWNHWMDINAPNVATRIMADDSDKLLNQVRVGNIDVALIYNAKTETNLIVESYQVDRLVLVSTTPRDLNKGWTPGYVFVNWGDEFMVQHRAAFPDSPLPRLTCRSEDIALNHILTHGGSGYFNLKDIKTMLADKKLHRVKDAPEFNRESFVVFSKNTPVYESIELALKGLRKIN